MTSKPEADDDSFIIILGSSPGPSMDTENCNGEVKGEALDKSQIEDVMKDLSLEANMAFKAQFNLSDSPSPASMMVASTIITDDRSTEELQKRFGELLDENVVLKETLKQNNDSMKEQFMLIASCQEDMLKTHRLHKEKFDETRDLVDKLRKENKQLKLDLSRIADGDTIVANGSHESKSGASSGIEFVTSPDDDTIEKLTAQLELVEKQRRQLIVDNEKLSWQKESLEHIIDATSKERDDVKKKLKNIELQLSSKENDHSQELQKLNFIINDLQSKLTSSSSNIPPEEMAKREAYTQQLETKITYLQNELKKAQMKILDLENVKLEFSQHKSGMVETIKMYKDQIQDLNNRIKEIQTTVFQPVRVSISSEKNTQSEYASYISNIKLYDRTLKHLSEYLNALTNGLSDSLVHTLGIIASLHDFKLERGSVERVKAGLVDLKNMVETQHGTALSNIAQVRGTMTIFEGIFKDYNEILKKSVTKTENKPTQSVEQLTAALVARGQDINALKTQLTELSARKDDCDCLKAQIDKPTQSVEQLTAALVARGQDINALETQLTELRARKDDCDLLKAQVDLYRSDFEAERESREKMASEKENIMTDLRTAQKKIQELTTQLEEIRILSPGIHKSVTAKRRPPSSPSASATSPTVTTTNPTPSGGNMSYTCPKCMRFSSDQYKVMEDHFDFCLDDF